MRHCEGRRLRFSTEGQKEWPSTSNNRKSSRRLRMAVSATTKRIQRIRGGCIEPPKRTGFTIARKQPPPHLLTSSHYTITFPPAASPQYPTLNTKSGQQHVWPECREKQKTGLQQKDRDSDRHLQNREGGVAGRSRRGNRARRAQIHILGAYMYIQFPRTKCNT